MFSIESNLEPIKDLTDRLSKTNLTFTANNLWELLEERALKDLTENSNSQKEESRIFFGSNEKGENKTLSWNDLYQESLGCAETLNDYFEVGPVIISLPNGPDFLKVFFACQRLGLIPVPLVSQDMVGTSEFQKRVDNLATINNIKQIVVINKKKLSIPESMVALDLEDLILAKTRRSHQNPNQIINSISFKSQSIALIQFSSGSTSEPKGVVLTHQQILSNLRQIANGLKVTASDILSSWLPLYHDMGLIGGFLSPLYNDVPVYLGTPAAFLLNPIEWLKNVAQNRSSILVGPDFMFRKLIDGAELMDPCDLTSVRACLSGSEPVKASTCKDFVKSFSRFGLSENVMMPVYGMAENVLAISFHLPGQKLKILTLNYKEFLQDRIKIVPENSIDGFQVVSCGRPLEDVRVTILNQNEESLGEESLGEIAIKGPSLFTGYYIQNFDNFEQRKEGFFKTGDLGFLHEGKLYIVGRKKDTIIIRGQKYHAVDLEYRIYEKFVKQVSRVAVVSMFDLQKQKDIIHIVIEPRSWLTYFWSNYLEKNLLFFLGSWISADDLRIIFVGRQQIPRTSSGKNKRYKLKRMLELGELDLTFSSLLLSHWRRAQLLFILKARESINRVKTQIDWSVTKKKMTHLMPRLKSTNSKILNIFTANEDPLKKQLLGLFAEVSQLPVSNIRFDKNISEYKLDSIQLLTLYHRLTETFGEVPLMQFYEFETLDDTYVFLKTRPGNFPST